MPFDEQGKLQVDGLKAQIDLMIESGVRAIVAGGSTGEGHTLSESEFVEAMQACDAAIAGRVPFVVGLIVNSTIEAVERVERIKDLDIAALQVTPVHYLFKPELEATIQHFQTIWDSCRLPILIYNVIPWNYLSAQQMLAIMEAVPGVVGMKQSSGDLKSLSDLLLEAKPNNLVLTGIDALLYSGFCTWLAWSHIGAHLGSARHHRKAVRCRSGRRSRNRKAHPLQTQRLVECASPRQPACLRQIYSVGSGLAALPATLADGARNRRPEIRHRPPFETCICFDLDGCRGPAKGPVLFASIATPCGRENNEHAENHQLTRCLCG